MNIVSLFLFSEDSLLIHAVFSHIPLTNPHNNYIIYKTSDFWPGKPNPARRFRLPVGLVLPFPGKGFFIKEVAHDRHQITA